jgi:hypothetical protein
MRSVRESATGNVVRYLGRNDPENIVQHEARILDMVLHRTRTDVLATFSEKQYAGLIDLSEREKDALYSVRKKERVVLLCSMLFAHCLG